MDDEVNVTTKESIFQFLSAETLVSDLRQCLLKNLVSFSLHFVHSEVDVTVGCL